MTQARSDRKWNRLAGIALLVSGSAVATTLSKAAEIATPTKVGVVSNVHVASDKIEDVSSLEAWKKSFIKEGMTDEQKAKAIWETVVKFRHQDSPANEFTNDGVNPIDPIKAFNVYGYGMCNGASGHIEALARYVGLKARGWGIISHSVPEVYY